MSKTRLIFTNRNFTFYFLADIISGIGSGISFIGFNWFILDITGSSANIGFFMALSLLSGLFFFPFAGTIADRFNRRNIIICLNIVLGIMITIISLVVYFDILLFETVYLVAVVNGIGFTVFIPASRGLVQEIIPRDEFITGNSMIEISLQVSIFLAAGLTGIIYKYFGFTFILLIDGLSFLLGAFFLLRIKYIPVQTEDRFESFSVQFLNGIKYLNKNRIIMLFGIFILIPLAVTIASNVVLPSYVNNYLKADSVEFGISEMCYGFGAFISGVFISRIMNFNKWNITSAISFLFILSALTLYFLYLNSYIAGLFAAYFIFGTANTSLKIILNTLLMETIPKTQFGRAMAFFMAFSAVIQIACTLGMGNLMDKFSANNGYLILALITVAGFILNISLIPAVTRMESEKYPEIETFEL